jgi:hypothetical protein
MADLSKETHGDNIPTKKLETGHPKAQYEVEPALKARETANPPLVGDDPLREVASLKQQMDVAKQFHNSGIENFSSFNSDTFLTALRKKCFSDGNERPFMKSTSEAESQKTRDKYTTSD